MLSENSTILPTYLLVVTFGVPSNLLLLPQGGRLGPAWVALGSPSCRLGRLLVALWCLEGSPEAQQYKKKPRFPFYVLTGLLGRYNTFKGST